MKLQPIKNLVLIERMPFIEKTRGGIILADSSKQPNQWGTVLDIGPKVDAVSVGDMVYFGKYAGTNIDDIQVILREEDILGFVKKEDNVK
jgi:chaperonin GroES